MHFPRTLGGALLSVLISPLPIQAAEWSAEPRISLRSGYNDNIRLTTRDHDSVWETALTPAVKFGAAREHQGLFGDASASIRRFSGGSGNESSSVLDREDYFLNTNAYHRTERDEFSALVNYTRDSTLDSELDTTGQALDNYATRTRLSLGPSWSRTLDERTRLTLGYNFSTVDYSDDSDVRDLVEYDYDVWSASLTRQFTPRLQGTLASSYSSYQPDTDAGLDSDTVNLQVGITRNFSETLTTSWLAGIRRTTSDTLIPTGTGTCFPPVGTYPTCGGIGFPVPDFKKDDTDDTGSVYSAEITKLLETGKISASLSRVSNPSGDGELLDTTRLKLSGEHKFTETLRTTLSVEYSNAETIANFSGIRDQTDQDLLRIRPKIFWRWRREWQLGAEYEYAEKDENNRNSDTATRNAFYLSLTYRQPKISLSR